MYQSYGSVRVVPVVATQANLPRGTLEEHLAELHGRKKSIGSYFAAEAMRNRRRARILAAPIGVRRVDA